MSIMSVRFQVVEPRNHFHTWDLYYMWCFVCVCVTNTHTYIFSCSPFEVVVSEAVKSQKVRAWGPGLETGMVGKSADFVVEAIGREVGNLGKRQMGCWDFRPGKGWTIGTLLSDF